MLASRSTQELDVPQVRNRQDACLYFRQTDLPIPTLNPCQKSHNKSFGNYFFSKEMRFLVPKPTYQLWFSFHIAKMRLYFCNKPTVTQTHQNVRCHRGFSVPWGPLHTFILWIKFTSKIHYNEIKFHYHKHWLCRLLEAQQHKTDCISDKLLFYSASSC